jgi:hypothetical protein
MEARHMTVIRNVSNQPFNLNRKGAIVQLLPKRAAAITDEEIKSSQVQNLLHHGFVRLEKIEKEKTDKEKKTIREKPNREKPVIKNEEKKE